MKETMERPSQVEQKQLELSTFYGLKQYLKIFGRMASIGVVVAGTTGQSGLPTESINPRIRETKSVEAGNLQRVYIPIAVRGTDIAGQVPPQEGTPEHLLNQVTIVDQAEYTEGSKIYKILSSKSSSARFKVDIADALQEQVAKVVKGSVDYHKLNVKTGYAYIAVLNSSRELPTGQKTDKLYVNANGFKYAGEIGSALVEDKVVLYYIPDTDLNLNDSLISQRTNYMISVSLYNTIVSKGDHNANGIAGDSDIANLLNNNPIKVKRL